MMIAELKTVRIVAVDASHVCSTTVTVLLE